MRFFLLLIAILCTAATWKIVEQTPTRIIMELVADSPAPTPTPTPEPPAGAGTHIKSAEISGDWLLAGSPYYVYNHVTVPNGKVLTICPGVKVIFKGPYKMSVKGILISEGSPEYPILFTAEDPVKGWYGLRWESNTHDTSPQNVVKYTTFEYGNKMTRVSTTGYQDNRAAALFVYGVENIVIENNTFRNNKAIDKCGAVMLLSIDGPISFKNNVFENNSSSDLGGAICFTHGKPQTVEGGSFKNNKGRNYGAIYNFDTYTQLSGVSFSGNTPNNYGGDIRVLN